MSAHVLRTIFTSFRLVSLKRAQSHQLYITFSCSPKIKVKVKSAYEPSGQLGRSLSRFLWHEATKSISTPPLDATPSIKFADTYLYTWMERGTVRVNCLAQEHNTMSPPGLEPRPLDPELSALTIRPLHLASR